MKTQRNSSMYRSGTMPISLPKISKLNVKQSRYKNNLHNRSSFHQDGTTLRDNRSKSFMQSSRVPFTHRVQQQVFDQNEYPYIQTSNIQKQHIKLKDLLKQFNDQTVNILQKYVIDKPVRKQYVKVKHPIQEIRYIRQKQSENSNSMIANLKVQIERLQARCQNLKYMSKQEFQQKIRQVKEQKQKSITQNKQLSRQITLNGIQIVRGKDSMVKQLQYQQLLIDSKRDRLKKQSQSVLTQIKDLEQKIKQINNQAQKYEQQQSYTLKQYEQLQKQKSHNRLYEQLSKKKKLLEHTKIMNQSSNFQLKHKYFQKLKELDQYVNRDQYSEKRIGDVEEMIRQSKESIAQLEKKEVEYSNKKRNGGENEAKINYLQGNGNAKINVQL